MKRSQDKVVMVTNQLTRYSALIRIQGEDSKRFLTEGHTAIMPAFDQNEVARPRGIVLALKTLSFAFHHSWRRASMGSSLAAWEAG